MTINLRPDTTRLTIDDMIDIDEGFSGKLKHPRYLRDFLARFACDEHGNFLEPEEAQKAIGKMTIPETIKAIQVFGQALKEVQDTAVNPTTSAG